MLNSHSTIPQEHLIPRSTQMTIGSTVCIAEGVTASIGVMLPKDQWFYVLVAVLMIAMWCAVARFRTSKLGADICDLAFFEVGIWLVACIWVATGNSTSAFWYPMAAISLLKLWRVYAPLGSTTQRHGWGVFGPMTYLFAKNHAPESDQPAPTKLYFALLGAIVMVAIGSIFVKMLSEEARVGMTWLIAILFEVVYGPRQLRSLAEIGKNAFGSEQREADNAAEIERLKQEVAAAKAALEAAKREVELLRNMQNAPSADHMALIEAYEITKPERKSQLVKIAQNVAEAFSIKGTPKQ